MSPEMREYMSKYMRANSVLIGTHRTEKQKQAAREIAESEMEFASEEKDESLQPEADE
jgi:hypothetical protein